MKRLILVLICMASAVVLTLPRTVAAQEQAFWEAAMGDWDNGNNWSTGFAPLGVIAEVAVINNGGVATVSSAVSEGPGAVLLGEAAADSGTLHIQNGGTLPLFAGDVQGVTLPGAVTVGGGGTGTLIVDGGGTLNAASLQSGGNDASSIQFGGGTAGTATIDISGNTTLARQTRIIGPDVALTTGTLNLSGTLTTEIGPTGHSTMLVDGAANLGGVLNLEFTDGFSPELGETFDLIDAGMINGSFSAIDANLPLGPGLVYAFQTQEGGVNGTIGSVGVELRLTLEVDRRTGATRIRNLADEQSVSINAYGITSATSVLDNSGWTTFSEGGPWIGNGSSTHVTELSYGGSREIGPEAEISLGNIYDYTPSAFGETMEDDLTFEYHVLGGDVAEGFIEYTGAYNNLVLVVDEENGLFLQNQSLHDVSINAYAIVSESGGLNPDEWISFVDGGNADWSEANAAPNHITELNQNGSLLLEGEGEAIPLGRILGPDAMRDLQFVFNIAGEGPFTGVVDYDQGVIEFMSSPLIPGDYNNNGRVEQADLDLVLLNWNEPVENLPDTWVNERPTTGIIDQAELDGVLLNWNRTTPGLATAAAVPEPAGWLLAALAATLAVVPCAGRRKPRRRAISISAPRR